MIKGIKYHTYIVEKHLKDPDRAAGYLREALEEGDLELLQAVVGDLIEAGYQGLKITGNQSNTNGDTQHFLDEVEIEMTQQVLAVKS